MNLKEVHQSVNISSYFLLYRGRYLIVDEHVIRLTNGDFDVSALIRIIDVKM